MAGWHENGTADETMAYGRPLRDLEAAGFRTSRTLTEHSKQLPTVREHQTTTFGHTGPLGNATGVPGEHTITGCLDTIEERLGTIEHVLFTLARRQGIDPATAG